MQRHTYSGSGFGLTQLTARAVSRPGARVCALLERRNPEEPVRIAHPAGGDHRLRSLVGLGQGGDGALHGLGDDARKGGRLILSGLAFDQEDPPNRLTRRSVPSRLNTDRTTGNRTGARPSGEATEQCPCQSLLSTPGDMSIGRFWSPLQNPYGPASPSDQARIDP